MQVLKRVKELKKKSVAIIKLCLALEEGVERNLKFKTKKKCGILLDSVVTESLLRRDACAFTHGVWAPVNPCSFLGEHDRRDQVIDRASMQPDGQRQLHVAAWLGFRVSSFTRRIGRTRDCLWKDAQGGWQHRG